MLRIELKKVFNNRLLWISIIIGAISGFMGLFSYYSDISYSIINHNFARISAYEAWLFCLSLGSGSIYRLLVPLLLIPYMDSYFNERKTGYSNMILTRTSHRKYFFSKLLAGILSANFIIVSILSLWLIVCFILFPGNIPNTETNFIPGDFMRGLYQVYPYIYIAYIYIINILFSIIFYMIGFSISSFAKKKYTVLILPFIIYLVLILVSQIFRINELYPINMIAPYEINNLTKPVLIREFLLMFMVAISMVAFFYKKDLKEVS